MGILAVSLSSLVDNILSNLVSRSLGMILPNKIPTSRLLLSIVSFSKPHPLLEKNKGPPSDYRPSTSDVYTL